MKWPTLPIVFFLSALCALPLRAQNPVWVAQEPLWVIRMQQITEDLAEDGALTLGPFNVNVGEMIRLSRSRGLYLGASISTNDRLSSHFRLKGFGGYWTHLKGFDYGGEAALIIAPEHETELGVRHAYKSTAMGEFSGFSEGLWVLSEKEYKYTFYENVLVRGHQTELFFQSRPTSWLKTFVTLGHYKKDYLRQYSLHPSDSVPTTRYSNAELKVWADLDPVVWVSYLHSFKGVLGSQHEYNRVKVQVEKDIPITGHGTSSVLLQLGYASSGCPVMETFDILGSYEDIGLFAPGCFSTMREEEFFCDRFAALFLCHDFQGTLWPTHSIWFQPELSILTHLGWGDMQRANDCPEKNFKTMEKGYFESGFVVHGLVRLPYLSIGAGAFYRYGAYANPRFRDNLSLNWSVIFKI